MSKVEQIPEQKTSDVEMNDPRKGMTLGEASDISSMTILRQQLEEQEREEKPNGKVE